LQDAKLKEQRALQDAELLAKLCEDLAETSRLSKQLFERALSEYPEWKGKTWISWIRAAEWAFSLAISDRCSRDGTPFSNGRSLTFSWNAGWFSDWVS